MTRRSFPPFLPAFLALVALLAAFFGQSRFDQFRATGLGQWSLVQQGLLAFLVGGATLLWSRLLTMNQAEPVAERLGSERLREHRRERKHTDATPPPARDPALLNPLPLNASLFSGSALLLTGLLLAFLARLPEPLPAGTPVWLIVLVWWAAVALSVAAWWAVPKGLTVERVTGWLQPRLPMLLGLGLIALLAAWLRLHHLATVPFTVNGDESSIALDVRALMDGPVRTPFMVGWGSHPIFIHYMLATMQLIFGRDIGAMRLMMALFGTAAVVATGLLGWVVGGRRVGLASALLLATMPWHIHYSRVLLLVVIDSWSMAATLALLLFGMREPQRRWPFVLAGLIGGLGQYVYTGSRLLPVLVLCYVVYLALFQRNRLRENATNLLALANVFIVVAAPLYLYGLRFSEQFNQRIMQEGIFQNGWLAQEALGRHQSQAMVLLDQLRRALFGFAFYPDQAAGWAAGRPMTEPLIALGLIVGLAVTVPLLRRDWRLVLMQGWFWAVVLAGGVLTVNPPTSNRLISAAPVACLFAVLGWRALTQGVARAADPERQPLWANTLFAIVIVLAAWLGWRTSDQTLAASRFGGSGSYAATLIARTLDTLPPDTTLVLLGNSNVNWGLSTFDFLLGAPPLHFDEGLGGRLPDTLPATGPLLFIVTPERPDDLTTIQQAFPDAVTRVRYNAVNEHLYHEVFVQR